MVVRVCYSEVNLSMRLHDTTGRFVRAMLFYDTGALYGCAKCPKPWLYGVFIRIACTMWAYNATVRCVLQCGCASCLHGAIVWTGCCGWCADVGAQVWLVGVVGMGRLGIWGVSR